MAFDGPPNNIPRVGPCCFCGEAIRTSEVDPCTVQVSTCLEEWQLWFCHAACFKARLANPPDMPGFFDPVHF